MFIGPLRTDTLECHGGEKPEGRSSLTAESLDTDFGQGDWMEIEGPLFNASPPTSHFLDLVEAHPADGPEPLSDHGLAARLSYFLWSIQLDAFSPRARR